MSTAYVVKLWFLIAGNVFKEMMFVVSQQLQDLLKSVPKIGDIEKCLLLSGKLWYDTRDYYLKSLMIL